MMFTLQPAFEYRLQGIMVILSILKPHLMLTRSLVPHPALPLSRNWLLIRSFEHNVLHNLTTLSAYLTEQLLMTELTSQTLTKKVHKVLYL